MSLQEETGEVDFDWPAAGKPCKTWYRIVGDLHGSKRPLVVLHGGPGLSPVYLYPLEDLWTRYGIPLLFYNQIGSGRSTHLPEKNGDGAFWSQELFCAELDNIIAKLGVGTSFDVFGHSWGGMLASAWAAKRPSGLNRFIISNSPISMATWERGGRAWLKTFPQDLQDTIEKHERAGTAAHNEEYEAACLPVYERHMCRFSPMPDLVLDSLGEVQKDSTVYYTMMGPSEFTCLGSLKTWSTEEAVKNINVPTLLFSGRHDFAQEDAVKPFFKNIPKIKWVLFENSSHMPLFEERERHMEICAEFLED